MRACSLAREIQASWGSAGSSRLISRVEGIGAKADHSINLSGKTISNIDPHAAIKYRTF